ncbi:MAG TPA: TasA family protein [Chloroflexota bacterium]|nr:TasA family protein [Chloroflexota bacterium]
MNGASYVLDNARQVVLSAMTGVLALCSVALGTYAGFSAETVGPGNTFATGAVAMTESFGSPNGGSGSFSFGTVLDLLPGETLAKYLDLSNTGTLDVDLSFDASLTSASSLLDSDATTSRRLQLEINRCPGTWSSVSGSVTCSATKEQLYSGQIAPGTTIPLTAGTANGAVAAGATAHLELRVTLPSAATTAVGQSSTFSFQWTATNR